MKGKKAQAKALRPHQGMALLFRRLKTVPSASPHKEFPCHLRSLSGYHPFSQTEGLVLGPSGTRKVGQDRRAARVLGDGQAHATDFSWLQSLHITLLCHSLWWYAHLLP